MMNKVMLIGQLGGNPESRFSQSGAAVTNMSLATNEVYKDKSGNQQKQTEWHRIVCFGRLAEICRDHLVKGRQVYIEGRIQTRKWEDKEGNTRHTTEIVAMQVKFLGRKSQEASAGPAEAKTEAVTPASDEE